MALTQQPAWQALLNHYNVMQSANLANLFEQDEQRFDRFSLGVGDLFLDYSKNPITVETIELLTQLAQSCNLAQHIERLFQGDKLNVTEGVAAWHVALRGVENPDVQATKHRMKALCDAVATKRFTGFTGEPITDIVHVGIGGSDLGPRMLYQAFRSDANPIQCHFVSNYEWDVLEPLLQQLNPATTIAIFTSKSFGTQETLDNASAIKQWFVAASGHHESINKHWFAVTANQSKAEQLGYLTDHIFPLWNWVGGRYSVWSAVSLSIAIALGYEVFDAFLQGAAMMDQHFKHNDFSNNMPVLLALIAIWHNNFFATPTKAIIPYTQRLSFLPNYLQQLHMESHGKSVNTVGENIDFATGRIIWGDVGTRCQHSFHQLLLQGTHRVPVDFIVPLTNTNGTTDRSRQQLVAHCLAQSQTLMQGYTEQQVTDDLIEQGIDKQQAQLLAKHKSIQGNIPSNTITLNRLTPYTLGALLALYEHKVFVQSVIWGVNAFDQWGVERGKVMANDVLANLQNQSPESQFDHSTQGLLNNIKKIWAETSS